MRQRHIGLCLRMLQNEVMRFIDQRARQEGLDKVTLSNGWILMTLYDNRQRDMFQKDIEAECGMARSTVTGVVKLMEYKGLIRREAVPDDARLKKLVLTEKGLDTRKTMAAIFQECDAVMTAGMSKEEYDAFIQKLQELRRNLLRYEC